MGGSFKCETHREMKREFGLTGHTSRLGIQTRAHKLHTDMFPG